MTPEQVRTNRLASMYGYKVNEDTVAAAAFRPGDKAIVLTAKGEPIMSGFVDEVREEDFSGRAAIKMGGQWFYEGEYKFRVM